MAVCIIVAPIADIAAFIAFFTYKANQGYSIFDFSNGSMIWEFLMTPLGAILTAFGIIPYGIAILSLYLVRTNDIASN